MANPYPADFQDGGGNVRISGRVDFTDPDNQPGASQPVSLAYTDLAFNTPGLFPQQFEITAVVGNVVTVAGDRRALFPAGSACAFPSDSNIGRLVVASTLVGGDTEVEVDDTTGVTPGEFLSNTGTAGVTVATLAAGDILHTPGTSLWVPIGWNGTDPTLHFGPGGIGAQGLYEFGSNAITLTSVDNDAFNNGAWWLAQAAPDAWGSEEYRAGAATTARVYVDDSSGGDPGSTAGTAIIALPIWRKP